MGTLEDLIANVSDAELRGRLGDELRALKRQKRFGLVFEEHLPEVFATPSLPIQVGATVRDRTERDGDLYQVVAVEGEKARVEQLGDGAEPREKPAADLDVIKRSDEPVYPNLRPLGSIGRNDERPWHAVVNGENFHALQLLLYLYESRVDCIYLDPPYNTGARDWKYNNRFVDERDSWRHSKWLAFMEKRLVLAKRLLKPDGVLICTVDEHEVHHLGMLLEQVFPEYDQTMVTAVINPKGTAASSFARVDEYVFFLTPPDREVIGLVPHEFGLPQKPKKDSRRVQDESGRHYRKLALRRDGAESSNRRNRPRQFYALHVDEETHEVLGIGPELAVDDDFDADARDGMVPVYPIDRSDRHRVWRYGRETMQRLIEKGEIRVTRYDEQHDSYSLYHFKPITAEEAQRRRPRTVWWHPSHDAGAHGSTLLNGFLGERSAFPFPKSVYAVADCLRLVVEDRPDALIVDYFAGSGTTLHATCLLNLEDGGRRRSIMVTNNEVEAERAEKMHRAGVYPGDPEFERHGIFEAVTRPRSEAVITGRRPDGEPVPGVHVWADRRPYAEGFDENVEFYALDHLDPDEVELGWRFDDILPALWMRAGAVGERPAGHAGGALLLPDHANFAVLFDEARVRDLVEVLEKRADITHVFLVTDSTEAFAEMRALLRPDLDVNMLYRDYLRMFTAGTRARR